MKKIIFLMVMSLVTVRVIAQNELPQWAQELVSKNPEVIESVVPMTPNPTVYGTQTFMIYYKQPVNHSTPNSPKFSLRATITVFNDADVTTAVNQVFIGGYALPEWWLTEADYRYSLMKESPNGEIAHRYHGTLIWPEYRYFQYSSPSNCYENLDDLRSQEAADDFHNLLEALKTVFKGKWVVSGGSKGGTATLLQHAFHPEDADVFVPYCAPFFDTYCDKEMQHYWYNNGLNQEIRNLFMSIRRVGIARMDNIYPIFYKMTKTNGVSDDEAYGRYLSSIAHFGFSELAYSDINEFYNDVISNRKILASNNVQEEDNDTLYAIMLLNNTYKLEKKSFQEWYTWLRYSKPQNAPSRRPVKIARRPFGVTEAEWWGNQKIGETEQAYDYQSKTELGYYDLCFDEIVSPEAVDSWNEAYKKYVGNLRDFYSPYFASCAFDRSLYDRAVSTTQNATKPIIFIYGKDDPWTGAAMRDKYINGTNVRKFILPGQNHGVHFTSNTDMGQCNTIRQLLDDWLSVPEGIDEIKAVKGQSGKALRNGHIYIMRNGKMYNTAGMLVPSGN